MRTSLTSLLRFPALLLGLLTLALVACEPTEEPEPCEPTPANAGFKVYEVFNRPSAAPLYLEVDTVSLGSAVAFRPDITGQSSYSWFIGTNGVNYKTPIVSLAFPFVTGPLSVSLTTTRFDQCSGRVTRDSLFRTNVFSVRSSSETELYGYYQGSTSLAPNDTFTIGLVYRSPCPSNPNCDPIFLVDNLPKGFIGDFDLAGDPVLGYYKFYYSSKQMRQSNPSEKTYFRALFDYRNRAQRTLTITLDQSSSPQFTTFTTFTFIGRKL